MNTAQYQQIYRLWLEQADALLQAELNAMAGHPEQIEDAFYRDLAFGTGGLRGVLGAGTNRMNVHVVGKGLSQNRGSLIAKGKQKK